MTTEEFNTKREEVIAKFSKEILQNNAVRYDPMLNKIIEMLIRDQSPYEIIEMLIKGRIEYMEKYKKLFEIYVTPHTYNKNGLNPLTEEQQ